MKKRIAFLTSDITTHGGTQRVITILANAFKTILGHQVIIYSLNHSKECIEYFLENDIELINLNQKYKFSNFGSLIKKVNLMNDRYNIDTILGIGCYFSILLPFIKCDNRIACEHNSYNLPSLKVRLLRKISYRNLENVVSLTKEDEKEYLKINKNTHVIPNPVPFEISHSGRRENLVVTIGSLNKRKSVDRLLDIWQEIEKYNTDFKLEIYGKGPDEAKLMELCKELKLNSVEFMGSTNNVDQVLLRSKILTLTSHNEGFPMILLEAMACGVPVISYDIKTGPNEIIRDNFDGFLIQDSHKDSFVKKLLSLMENDRLLREFSLNSQQSVRRFSINNIVYKWDEIL